MMWGNPSRVVTKVGLTAKSTNKKKKRIWAVIKDELSVVCVMQVHMNGLDARFTCPYFTFAPFCHLLIIIIIFF